MTPLQSAGALATGATVGFLGGLFGKGGSAVATPLLSLCGFPGFLAVASPLPATVPGTLAASAAYWRQHWLDWEVIVWSASLGVPATIAGSFLSPLVGAGPLLIATGALVLGFGLAFLMRPQARVLSAAPHGSADENGAPIGTENAAGLVSGRLAPAPALPRPGRWRLRLSAVALAVGVISGLLANSGGFLLAPAFALVLKLPLKTAFACSLLVSVALAIPGTLAHWYLGHISWFIAALVAIGAMPLSYAGARLAIRTRTARLERWYGLALTALGIFFLAYRSGMHGR